MRRNVVIIGIGLVLIGALLAYYPAPLQYLSSVVMAPNHTIVQDRTFLVTLDDSGYRYQSIQMTPADSLLLTLRSSPPGTDLLLMNQGNFSLFRSGNVSSYSVYPQSTLDFENLTLSFNDTSFNGSLYLVFVPHLSSPNGTVDVLIHVLQTRTTASRALEIVYFPIAIFGVVLVGLGLFTGKAPRKSQSGIRCKFCGAEMKPGEAFCPKCKKSQR